MDGLAAGHDATMQMIDTSVVRLHQHGACIADNNHQDMGRSRGGLTSKIHAVVDTNGLPVHLALSRPARHTTIGCVRFSSARCCRRQCYSRIEDTTRTGSESLPASRERGRTFRRSETASTRFASALICIAHELNRTVLQPDQQCRRVATRYDKLAANYLAFVKLASIRIWLRAYESTP
jgi:transposase